jgi:uncharacterized Tic20 family protein
MDLSSFVHPPRGFAPTPASREERQWGTACHLSSLLVLTGVPLLNIVGPLVVWLLRKDRYAFVDDQGKEAMNFQISITLYVLIALALTLTVVLAPLTLPLLVALAVFDIVMIVIATIKANDGVAYRYPLTLRLIA